MASPIRYRAKKRSIGSRIIFFWAFGLESQKLLMNLFVLEGTSNIYQEKARAKFDDFLKE